PQPESALPGPGLSDPLIVNELVVVGSDSGMLRAFDEATGKLVWSYAHGMRIYARPESDGKRVFAISESGGAVAVMRHDGSLAWSQPSQLGFGAVATCAEAELVFLAGNDGIVRALDTSSGKERWATNVVNDAPPDPPGFNGNRARFQGKPARPTAAACDGKWIFVSLFDQSRVVGFDIADGTKKFDYQAGGWVFHAPLIDGDRVFIGGQDKVLYCIDRSSSKLAWKFRTKGRIESSAAVHGEKVYIGSCDGAFSCVNRDTGEDIWTFDIQTDGQQTTAIYSDPLILDDNVCFAAGEGHVYALDLNNGKLRWKFRPLEDSELFTSPASDGRFIYVSSRPQFNNMGQAVSGKAALIAIDPYFQAIDPFAPRNRQVGPARD
ncbi:MAG TPA: PQQ-binding-like beta-propeller repeat protein, partial [Pirellulales bacterium]|nr:PQQ-binding-like beta-propeller repeat protein [Pirellulales bacterium]